jgi:hypothetical protein
MRTTTRNSGLTGVVARRGRGCGASVRFGELGDVGDLVGNELNWRVHGRRRWRSSVSFNPGGLVQWNFAAKLRELGRAFVKLFPSSVWEVEG